MNIFYLDTNPATCAEYHCDKHVLKMIIEYAQLLSTAHRILDGEETKVLSNSGKTMTSQWKLDDYREQHLYKCAYINHPSNKWVRESHKNYLWLRSLLDKLLTEYTHRYERVHAVDKRSHLFLYPPKNIEHKELTPMPQCMPDDCKVEHMPILAYQNFYIKHKRPFCNWTKRPRPIWFT